MTEVETAAEYLRAAALQLRRWHQDWRHDCNAPACRYDLAVADWLDEDARFYEMDPGGVEDELARRALAVAAAVLGRDWVPS